MCDVLKIPNCNKISFFPYVGIVDPLAARRGAADGEEDDEEDAGKTDRSAPVSTKKEVLERESQREIVDGGDTELEGGDGVTASRLGRFPENDPVQTSSVDGEDEGE